MQRTLPVLPLLLLLFHAFALAEDVTRLPVVAIVSSMEGQPEDITFKRAFKRAPMAIGQPIIAADELVLSPKTTVTLILFNGRVQTLDGPVQWKAAEALENERRSQPGAAPLFERLTKWFESRNATVARGAGSRGSPGSVERLHLICAEIAPRAQTNSGQGKAEVLEATIFWIEPLAPEAQLRFQLWADSDLLTNAPVVKQVFQQHKKSNLSGATLFLSASQAQRATHVQLSDAVRSRLGRSNALPWTNVWHAMARVQTMPPVARAQLSAVGPALAQAIVLEAEGRPAAALESYLQIITKFPRHTETYYALARFFDEHGPSEIAAAYAEQARSHSSSPK